MRSLLHSAPRSPVVVVQLWSVLGIHTHDTTNYEKYETNEEFNCVRSGCNLHLDVHITR